MPATSNTTPNTFTDGATTLRSTTYTSADKRFHNDDVGAAIIGPSIQAGTTIVAVEAINNSFATLSAAATGTGSGLTYTVAGRDPFPDAFVAKLNSSGSGLLYSTFLGHNNYDFATGIALGSGGVAYVSGDTDSAGFPTTANAYDSSCGADANCHPQDSAASAGPAPKIRRATSTKRELTNLAVGKTITGTNIPAGTTVAGVVSRREITLSAPATGTDLAYSISGLLPVGDAFVARVDTALSGASSLTHASFLGGSDGDSARGVAVDSGGRAYVVGHTSSSDPHGRRLPGRPQRRE